MVTASFLSIQSNESLQLHHEHTEMYFKQVQSLLEVYDLLMHFLSCATASGVNIEVFSSLMVKII